MSQLDARLTLAGGRPFRAAGDVIALKRRRNLTVETSVGAVDIVQHAPGVPSFAALDDHAVESDLLGETVRICSLAHLRQMKMARDNAQDRADLEHLPPA